ncbi:MAG TPA: VOC family protein [Candidatus Microsaccharimonas sp.]|jgi:predicted enzyme related to lactoylglutathione lyase
MLRGSKAFSGFSVKDLDEAEEFYGHILELDVKNTGMGLELHLGKELVIFVYAKDDHVPATFTILNFPVDDITETVEQLSEKGVEFTRYDNMPVPQDEYGILRGKAAGYGPDIAWFTDPSGNILSILSD